MATVRGSATSMGSVLYPSCSRVHSNRGYIGLSFSGGGYRATAFSLGTMALLQDLGLLSKARVMSSVSGGSLALAAFLCAKAGSRPKQESDFHFYDHFWNLLMQALEGESFADAFVRLPLLLQGEKVVLHAADATQRFLSALLDEEACLGNELITGMLRNHNLAPDYVFFNASNIVSLDLFRFGIQRGKRESGPEGEPVYVLNRYFLQAEGGSVEASELYRHARHLRLGDCVAASFAFPGAFEPLIFPHDYYRPGHSPAGPEGAQHARDHFSGSLICDRKPYVAFLDGGLYDNLGLASVEDIRRFLLRRSNDLEQRAAAAPNAVPAVANAGKIAKEQEQLIHYVIATDVDNIQPGIGFYTEPGFAASSVEEKAAASAANTMKTRRSAAAASRRKKNHSLLKNAAWALLALLVIGLVLLLSVGLLACILFVHRLVSVSPGLAWILGLLVLASTALVLGNLRKIRRYVRLVFLPRLRLLLRRLRGWFRPAPASAAPTWRQQMGLSREFDRQGIDNDWLSLLIKAVMGVLRAPEPAARLADLRAMTFERRAGQLLPAFNGYLKRTRSLTYGYLQQTYDLGETRSDAATAQAGNDQPDRHCFLIRNMIFELIPGPDVDPAYASNLITLPVQSYRRLEDIEPIAPIMRKLRHADYVRDLLDRRAGRLAPRHAGCQPSPTPRPMQLPLELLQNAFALQKSINDLNLSKSAQFWSWLTASLELDCHQSREGAPNRTIGSLLESVRQELGKAMEAATHAHPGVAEPLLRKRCTVKFGEDATSYSWIPLICEMATNLNTTLWLKGFRWYRPNQLEGQRIVAVGGWFVEPPQEASPMPLLDLGGLRAPAAAITALAGYINITFNLLEFLYTSLGSSEEACNHLVGLLSKSDTGMDTWNDDRRKDLADLPFVLRDRTLLQLRRISQQQPHNLSPGQLALIEPWLMVREGYPDAWRESLKAESP
ncbi:MAG: patatin-like phospholipase family protein [Synechococcaceae cyanobacterium]|nr:patatin-like phospholipase family protein [Synechococcaceae cyanobacterium]